MGERMQARPIAQRHLPIGYPIPERGLRKRDLAGSESSQLRMRYRSSPGFPIESGRDGRDCNRAGTVSIFTKAG
jgi:hypothetical protein